MDAKSRSELDANKAVPGLAKTHHPVRFTCSMMKQDRESHGPSDDRDNDHLRTENGREGRIRGLTGINFTWESFRSSIVGLHDVSYPQANCAYKETKHYVYNYILYIIQIYIHYLHYITFQ